MNSPKIYYKKFCPVLCYFNPNNLFYKEYPSCKCVKKNWELYDDQNYLCSCAYVCNWEEIMLILSNFEHFVNFYNMQKATKREFARSQSLEGPTKAITFSRKIKKLFSFKQSDIEDFEGIWEKKYRKKARYFYF